MFILKKTGFVAHAKQGSKLVLESRLEGGE
jgi:hypothetical protein